MAQLRLSRLACAARAYSYAIGACASRLAPLSPPLDRALDFRPSNSAKPLPACEQPGTKGRASGWFETDPMDPSRPEAGAGLIYQVMPLTWCDQNPTLSGIRLCPYSEHSWAQPQSHDSGKLLGDGASNHEKNRSCYE
jgi:hypothetical protein